ncbi:MAG: GNAT family N-acyltransferase [Chitinispirillaceae bacterium]
MKQTSSAYIFKIADTEEEFSQIHKLNYKTFVEEIPQKDRNKDRILIDEFHKENTYFICKTGRELIGMLALRGQRPFSLDKKIADLDRYLPSDIKPCEIRMLSIVDRYRYSMILLGLFKALRPIVKEKYDVILISGYEKKMKLYTHMGFQPFAYKVGKENALYQPMFLRTEHIRRLDPLIDRYT